MIYFPIVIQQIALFIVYAVIGVYAVKRGYFSSSSLDVISKLLIKITIPVMLFSNTVNGATRQEFIAALPILLATVLMYVLLFLLSLLLAGLFGMKGNRKHVYQACTMYGNIGFIGIPIVAALFPERGMLYIALFTVIDQLTLWTVGIGLTAPTDSRRVLSPAEVALKMINPAVIAILSAVVFVFAGWHLPDVLNTGLKNVGGITPVLAMIYIGGLFCFTNIPDYLKHMEIYAEILVKMVLFPPAFFLILRIIPGLSEEIRFTLSVLTALPTMSTIPMFARDQKSDGEYGAGMLFVTTACAVVTVPLVCLIGFISSVALAIYSIRNLVRIGEKL